MRGGARVLTPQISGEFSGRVHMDFDPTPEPRLPMERAIDRLAAAIEKVTPAILRIANALESSSASVPPPPPTAPSPPVPSKSPPPAQELAMNDATAALMGLGFDVQSTLIEEKRPAEVAPSSTMIECEDGIFRREDSVGYFDEDGTYLSDDLTHAIFLKALG